MLSVSKLLYPSLLLFSTSVLVRSSPVSLKSARSFLDNYKPSPDRGDTSAQARELPGRISAIVVVYILVFVFTWLGIRRIRKKRLAEQEQTTREGKAIELREAANQVVRNAYESPISPGGNRAVRQYPGLSSHDYIWPSTNTWLGNNHVSPVARHPNVNRNTAQADEAIHQARLADIYTHVMSQEAAVAAGISPKSLPALKPTIPPQRPMPSPAPQRSIFSIAFPKKTKAKAKIKPQTLDLGDEKQSRTAAIISSLMSPRRKGVKNFRISEPTVGRFTEYGAGDEEPLTPRGPPPSMPNYSHRVRLPPASSAAYDITPISPVRSIAETSFPIHTPRSSSSASLQGLPKIGAPFTQHENVSCTSFTQPREPPIPTTLSHFNAPTTERKNSTCPKPRTLTPLNIPSTSLPRTAEITPSTATANMSAATAQTTSTTSQSALLISNPLNRPLALRQYTTHSPTSPVQTPLHKTTFLERPSDSRADELRTPWTAGAVPLSPYQPFSPVMPITPRLLGRKELRDRRRVEEEQRRRRGEVELVTPTEW